MSSSMAATERRPDRVGVSRPSDPTYIGSRHLEIQAMIAEASASALHSLGDPPAVAARTGRPVADDSERVAARQVREAPELDRLDLDAVEHRSDPYGRRDDGIGCGRCYTYRMQCERRDCPGAAQWRGNLDDVEHTRQCRLRSYQEQR